MDIACNSEMSVRMHIAKETEKREQALTGAVESQRKKLLFFIRRRIRDQAEAEDVLQEVLEEFVAAYDINQVIESMGAWLMRVAQNKLIDRFRKKKDGKRFPGSANLFNTRG